MNMKYANRMWRSQADRLQGKSCVSAHMQHRLDPGQFLEFKAVTSAERRGGA